MKEERNENCINRTEQLPAFCWTCKLKGEHAPQCVALRIPWASEREDVRETEGNTTLWYFLSLLHNFSLAERLSIIVVLYQRALINTSHIVVFYRQPEHKVYSRYSDTASLCLSFCSAWRPMGLRLFLNYPNYKPFTLFKLHEWNVEAPTVIFFDSQHILFSFLTNQNHIWFSTTREGIPKVDIKCYPTFSKY